MKLKILICLLFITSLLGYLEWGEKNHSFLFQAEFDILKKLFQDPAGVAHPFIVLPLLGQLLLLIALFQRNASRMLIYISIFCIGILLFFMFLIGILLFNVKIILSVLPFMILAVMTVLHLRNSRKVDSTISRT